MANNTVALSVGEAAFLTELDAIRAEILRGISLLQDTRVPPEELDAIRGVTLHGQTIQRLACAVPDTGDAEYEESLRFAAEHLKRARNRMECALLRFDQAQRA